MKKTLCFITALACAVALSACGSDSEKSTSQTETQTTTQLETTSEVETSAEATTTIIEESTEEPTEESAEESTEEITEAETIAESAAAPTSSSELVDIIGENLDITNVTAMAADMIGAEEGTSFKYNGNKFEVYRFKADDSKIEQAESGTITLTVEGFGDFTMNTAVNGDFVMIYDNPEDAVIEAFTNIPVK